MMYPVGIPVELKTSYSLGMCPVCSIALMAEVVVGYVEHNALQAITSETPDLQLRGIITKFELKAHICLADEEEVEE